MSEVAQTPADIAAALVTVINERDPEGLERLLGPGAEIVTGRSVHSGEDAVRKWANKEYDHLRKVYAIDEYRTAGERVLALGAVQYVWTEGGEVADSTPIALVFELAGGAVNRLTVHDDARSALLEFEAGAAG